MRLQAAVLFILLTSMTSTHAWTKDTSDTKPVPRDDIYHLTLSDGLTLSADVLMPQMDGGEPPVMLSLAPRYSGSSHSSGWHIDKLTCIEVSPKMEHQYVLVNHSKDRIFIFAPWNQRYFVIDRHTGRMLKKGKGEDVLRKYDTFTPLRLKTRCIPRSDTPSDRTDHDYQQLEQLKADMIALCFSQQIAGSKLKRFCVVQFDPHPDAHVATKCWNPLFVVIWQAENADISLDTQTAIAEIRINGFLVTPPVRKGIYLLQPDYSLRQLRLTPAETVQLFAHIRECEDRAMTSWERLHIPLNSHWEEKVIPYLKVVEPVRVCRPKKLNHCR